MERTEINKLIAEFMGAMANDKEGTWFVGFNDFPHPMHESSLGYHTSWDWLMPVVEKIHAHAKINVTITKYSTRIDRAGIFNPQKIAEYGVEGDTMLFNTYRAVIDYITWYNSNS